MQLALQFARRAAATSGQDELTRPSLAAPKSTEPFERRAEQQRLGP
jgi:hypothetical protein